MSRQEDLSFVQQFLSNPTVGAQLILTPKRGIFHPIMGETKLCKLRLNELLACFVDPNWFRSNSITIVQSDPVTKSIYDSDSRIFDIKDMSRARYGLLTIQEGITSIEPSHIPTIALALTHSFISKQNSYT